MRRFIFRMLLVCATAVASPGQIFTTLLDFNGINGAGSYGALVEGIDARLYGCTEYGGSRNAGTVFSISTAGALITLDNFTGPAGAHPQSALLETAKGLLYGTASAGGANQAGAVFTAARSENGLAVLHSFDVTDGSAPIGGLVQGFNGMLYGTTSAGGAYHDGTIFAIAPDGTLTTLHMFRGTDGAAPLAAPIQGSDGLLYGTTSYGGSDNYGTVYSITPGGVFTLLHSFSGNADGATPYGGLVQGSDGNLYGTTQYGGSQSIFGAIFRVTPAGDLTILYSFMDYPDGAYPTALTQGSDGNLYGTTSGGGNLNFEFGAIFQITPAGVLTTLHTFTNADGATPFGGVVQHTDGAFYGTTTAGGTSSNGTIYRLITGLPPFVKTFPAFGTEGTKIAIVGPQLSGATSVTFNGVPAEFAPAPGSSSAITATVPSGAVTGTVQVVTPGGAYSSNVAFQVLP